MRLLSSLLLLSLSAVPVWSQEKEKEKRDPIQPIKVVKVERKEPVTWEKDVEPILVNKCNFCHSGPLKEGQLDLSSHEAILKGGKRGPALVPGKASESLLIRVGGKTERPFMPPKVEEPLTPEELAILKLWIDQGARPPATLKEKPKILLTTLPPTIHPVRALAISPDKTVVAAGRANAIHLYNAISGEHLRSLVAPNLKTSDGKPVTGAHLTIVEALAFSPDGKQLASSSFQEVLLWDVQTGKILQQLGGFAERVMALAFSPDGKLLATGGGAPTEDGEVKVFEVATGKLVCDIKNGHSDTVFGVSFSPISPREVNLSAASAFAFGAVPMGVFGSAAGTSIVADRTVLKLAACGADKFVKVFEMPSGRFLKAFEGHTHHVMDVAWRFDGRLLASVSADNSIKVWDYEKGEQTRTIGGHGKQVTRLAFVGTTSQIVTCSGDQTVRFWNVENGGNVRNFAGNTDYLYAVGASADGQMVIAGGEEGVVRLYNGTNGQLLKSLLPPGVAPKK